MIQLTTNLTVQENKMFKSKYDLWLDNQNEATRVYLKNQMKESDKLIWLGFSLGVPVGLILAVLISTVL